MSNDDFAGTTEPKSVLGIPEPADPEALAGIPQPDLLSGTLEPARLHWAADLGGDGGKGIEVYDGKHFDHFSTITEVAIAAAAAGISEVRIERTDIPFGMKRSAIQAEFVNRGIKLLQVHPARTAQYRTRWGLLKTDANDAFILWHLKCDFSVPREVTTEWKEFSARINRHANVLRYTKFGKVTGNVFIKRTLKKILGKGSIPKEVLTSSGDLSAGGLAFIIASLHTKSRADAERLAGVYGNAHSCQLRSDICHHGISVVKKRGISASVYRRGLRQLRRIVMARKEEILQAIPSLAA
jgi:hypothetical protein